MPSGARLKKNRKIKEGLIKFNFGASKPGVGGPGPPGPPGSAPEKAQGLYVHTEDSQTR